MKAVLSLCLVVLLVGPAAGEPPVPFETDLDGFVHEITEKLGADSIRTRQWVYPLQVRTPIPGGTLEVHSALMQVEQRRDTTVVDVWGPLDTGLCFYYGIWVGAVINAAIVMVLAGLLLSARKLLP